MNEVGISKGVSPVLSIEMQKTLRKPIDAQFKKLEQMFKEKPKLTNIKANSFDECAKALEALKALEKEILSK